MEANYREGGLGCKPFKLTSLAGGVNAATSVPESRELWPKLLAHRYFGVHLTERT